MAAPPALDGGSLGHGRLWRPRFDVRKLGSARDTCPLLGSGAKGELGLAQMSQEQVQPLADPSPAASELLSSEFSARSFGGDMVWAQGEGFVAKILRVRAGEKVRVTGKSRKDMHIMLSGGRASLESNDASPGEPKELLPGHPVSIARDSEYRLIAMTDAELLSIYTPVAAP